MTPERDSPEEETASRMPPDIEDPIAQSRSMDASDEVSQEDADPRPSQPALPSGFVNNLANLASLKPGPATKAPKDALQAVYAAGVYKANLTLDILCVQSFMAGTIEFSFPACDSILSPRFSHSLP
jgi:hypothetical protein